MAFDDPPNTETEERHPPREILPSRNRALWKRSLVLFTGGLLSLVCLILVLLLWVLPKLVERGDLNSLVESLLESSLNFPLQIGKIETEPFSRLAITRVTSLRSEAEERFQLKCDRLSLLYSPLDLLGGRVEELTLIHPELFLNLDSDLSGIFEVPEMMASPSKKMPSSKNPFGIGHFSLQDGKLTLRYNGEDFLVEELNIEVFGVGSRENLAFRLDANLFGADFKAWGALSPRIPRSDPQRYTIPEASVTIQGLNLQPFLALLYPLMDRLGAVGLEENSTVNLEGSAHGVWPQRVELALQTSVVDAAAQKRLELTGAASVFGELETIDFSLALAAENKLGAEDRESHGTIRTEILGTFSKEIEHGQLRIKETSYLEHSALGRAKFGGTLSSIFDRPQMEFEVRLEGVDLPWVVDLLPFTLAGDQLEVLRGVLDGGLTVSGLVEAPVLGGGLTVSRGQLQVGGEVFELDVRAQVDKVEDLLGPRPHLYGLALAVTGIDLSTLRNLSALSPASFTLGGDLNLRIEVPEWSLTSAPEVWHLDLIGAGVAFSLYDGTIETEQATFQATIDGALAAEPPDSSGLLLTLKHQMSLTTPLLVVGTAEEILDTAGMTAQGTLELSVSSSAVVVKGLHTEVGWPTVGPVKLAGTAAIGETPSDRPETDLRVELSRIPLHRFLEVYLRDAFQEQFSFLEGATFDGQSAATLRIRSHGGRLGILGRWSSHNASVKLPSLSTEIGEISVDLPFKVGDETDAAVDRGFLSLGSVKLGNIELHHIDLPLSLENGHYRFEKSAFDLLEGTVELRSMDLAATHDQEPLGLSLKISDVNLKLLAEALGLPAMEGVLEADLRRVHLGEEQLVLEGELVIRAFGGIIRLGDLLVNDFTEPYFTVTLKRGAVEQLDLLVLGRVFDFGVMSGIVDGTVEDLVVTPGHIVRFKLDVETVKVPGVARFIEVTAIESIQKVVAGYFSGLGDLLFKRFYYEGFGFSASLKNNHFRLRGKYEFDGVEHLMYSRWWQLPKIDIINTRPNRDYDWKRIFSNLRSIFKSGSQRAPEGTES